MRFALGFRIGMGWPLVASRSARHVMIDGGGFFNENRFTENKLIAWGHMPRSGSLKRKDDP